MEMIYRSNSRMKSSFRSKTWIESQSFKRTEKTSQIGRANKKNPIILGERELAAESSSTVWIGFGRNRGCWKLLIICLLGSLHLWLLMYTYILYIYICWLLQNCVRLKILISAPQNPTFCWAQSPRFGQTPTFFGQNPVACPAPNWRSGSRCPAAPICAFGLHPYFRSGLVRNRFEIDLINKYIDIYI